MSEHLGTYSSLRVCTCGHTEDVHAKGDARGACYYARHCHCEAFEDSGTHTHVAVDGAPPFWYASDGGAVAHVVPDGSLPERNQPLCGAIVPRGGWTTFDHFLGHRERCPSCVVRMGAQ